jgi:hypothetical protein
MGHIKLPVDQLISCDAINQITAAISSNTLTIDVVYNIVGQTAAGDFACVKSNIVYTKGASNSFVKSEAEYLSEFVDACSKMSGASGSSVAGPIVEQKVTASGALVGAITPTVTIKKGSNLA